MASVGHEATHRLHSTHGFQSIWTSYAGHSRLVTTVSIKQYAPKRRWRKLPLSTSSHHSVACCVNGAMLTGAGTPRFGRGGVWRGRNGQRYAMPAGTASGAAGRVRPGAGKGNGQSTAAFGRVAGTVGWRANRRVSIAVLAVA